MNRNYICSGESTSDATKVSLEINKYLFGLGDQVSTYGRKIDLLFGLDHSKKRIEVSSNEWKRDLVSQDIINKQQCKNLRTNACIINQIWSRYKVDTQVIAMDFVGNSGHLYVMKKTEEGVFIAKPIQTLIIPQQIDHIKTLKSTLNSMFQMKVSSHVPISN